MQQLSTCRVTRVHETLEAQMPVSQKAMFYYKIKMLSWTHSQATEPKTCCLKMCDFKL